MSGVNSSNSNELGTSYAYLLPLPKKEGECIDDDIRYEISEAFRVVVEIPSNFNSGVIFSVNPPTDTSKLWQPVDAGTGLPIGNVKKYDNETASWIDFTSGSNTETTITNEIYESLPRLSGVTYFEQDSVRQIQINDLEFTSKDDYSVQLTLSTEQESGGFLGMAGSDPRFAIIQKAANSFKIQIKNVTDPVAIEWLVVEKA